MKYTFIFAIHASTQIANVEKKKTEERKRRRTKQFSHPSESELEHIFV